MNIEILFIYIGNVVFDKKDIDNLVLGGHRKQPVGGSENSLVVTRETIEDLHGVIPRFYV